VVQNPPKFERFTVTQYEIVPNDSAKNTKSVIQHNDEVLKTAWFGKQWNVNDNVHWTQTDGDFMAVTLECTKFRIYFESHEWTGNAEIRYHDVVDTFNTYSDNPVEQLDTIFYETNDLPYDFHEVKITSLDEALGIKRLELFYSYPFYRKIITIKEFRDTCLVDSLRTIPVVLL
jgi:hypothetical protein